MAYVPGCGLVQTTRHKQASQSGWGFNHAKVNSNLAVRAQAVERPGGRNVLLLTDGNAASMKSPISNQW